ncbi:MAG TPA: SUMF1/EgtB/PvdO family nonheme iron enzyme [Blastocatellia bacterium]|nr:SUMF1/EgtB/PvdO family nonheme iron enzyme [Blastocatellia bacterium]
MDANPRQLRVFLCHSSKDKPAVRDLYGKLFAGGFKPWLDEEDLLPGQEWANEIPKAVRASDVVLVCLSPYSINKQGYVQKELKFALDVADEQPEGTIFVIPVKLEECDVPDRLSRWQWVNLYEDRGYDRLVKSLEHRSAELKRPAPKSASISSVVQARAIPNAAMPAVSAIESTEAGERAAAIARREEVFTFETVTLDETGKVASQRQGDAGQLVHELAPGVTLEMVAIPGGEFVMGAPEGELSSEDRERPQHKVTLSPFYMGKYVVTQAQWHVVAGWPRNGQDLRAEPSNFSGEGLPVEQVSWDDAVEFCARLAKRTGENYRLPTEAEWEYACRAGTTTPFAFGETLSPKLVNYNGSFPYGKAAKGESRGRTTPVGALGVANGFGLYDVHGNVWEWCGDWFGPYEAGASTDPLGRPKGEYRVLRGGAWAYDGNNCRSAYRLYFQPDVRLTSFGFRVVVVPRTS